jgi:predicted transcriptional regulator
MSSNAGYRCPRFQQDFPVVQQSRVIGILTRTELLAALGEHGQDHPVAAAMRRDYLVTDYTEMLETAFERLQECECRTVPVVHEGRLFGLLTMDNLGECLLIQAAIEKGDTRAGLPNGLVKQGAPGAL